MGFLFFPVMPMGLRWAALRAAGAPLSILQESIVKQRLKHFLTITECMIKEYEIRYEHAIMQEKANFFNIKPVLRQVSGIQGRKEMGWKFHSL